jgi:hypothetical protein
VRQVQHVNLKLGLESLGDEGVSVDFPKMEPS